ncbi:MAG: F0F1 ATP synthase subunit gamma [Deltaproteobacteria bacterium]|nr:F0F1 ATP synthase subunit gamma [Deltaproteobacteria bacterium]
MPRSKTKVVSGTLRSLRRPSNQQQVTSNQQPASLIQHLPNSLGKITQQKRFHHKAPNAHLIDTLLSNPCAESSTQNNGDIRPYSHELFSLPSSVDTITTHVQEAVLKLEARRREYGETGLTLFYNAPLAGSSYKQEMRPLLPPDEAWLSNLGTDRWPGRSLPFYRTAWPEIFPALIGEYLFVSLFHGYAASMSAENAARLSSMHRAERNTREMIEDLTFRHNSLRQEKINEELLEVVSGFEALKSEEQW